MDAEGQHWEAPRRARAWVVAGTAAALALVGVGAAALLKGTRPKSVQAPTCEIRRLDARVAEAALSPGIEATFGPGITAYETARANHMVAASRKERRSAQQALVAARDGVAGSVTAIFREIDEDVRAQLEAVTGTLEAGDDAEASVQALNDLLERKGVPAFVDVYNDISVGNVLFGFHVLQRAPYQYGGERLTVVHLRELTRYRMFYNVHGLQRGRNAMVFPDLAFSRIATRVLPALAPDGRLPLGQAATEALRDLEVAFGKALRRTLDGCLADLSRLGRLAEARAALLTRWEREHDIALSKLARPGEIWRPWGVRMREGAIVLLREKLERVGVMTGAEQLAAIETQFIDDDEAVVGGTLAHDLLAETERHELQHLLDARGDAHDETGYRLPHVGDLACLELSGGCRELSAYLATLADGPERSVVVGLANQAGFILDEDWRDHAEQLAAVTIIEGLTGEHVRDAQGEVLTSSAIETIRRLIELHPSDIRAKASALWETIFGEPVPRLVRAK